MSTTETKNAFEKAASDFKKQELDRMNTEMKSQREREYFVRMVFRMAQAIRTGMPLANSEAVAHLAILDTRALVKAIEVEFK